MKRRAHGFTLIELMIVVAIIGVLAAIAIPNFLMFQLRSKAAEAKLNMASIRTAEESHFAEFGSYVGGCGFAPVALPNPRTQKNPWPAASMFNTLGWAPEGDVYYQYGVCGGGALPMYTIVANGDLDGDTVTSDYIYVHPAPNALAGIAGMWGAGCSGTGAYNPATGAKDVLNSVGPCTQFDGRNEF